ncbi:MAG TPA: hypothetical protein PLL26_01665 [Candidatus Dojkabacteria bacterium]|nr:hypothetical protein [Candidatus Dojkabacteria bacterium]
MKKNYREWAVLRHVPRIERGIDPMDENYINVKSVLVYVANHTADGIEKEQLEEDPIVYMGIWGDETDKSDPEKIKKEYRFVAGYLEALGNGHPLSLSLRKYRTIMREYRGLCFHKDRYSGRYEGEDGKGRLRAKYPDVKGPSLVFDVCKGYDLSVQEMQKQVLSIANQVRKENAIYRKLG